MNLPLTEPLCVPERSLPHSAESERAILGALIINNSLAAEASVRVQPSDFYIVQHRRIYEAMLELFKRGAELNPILIGEELRASNLLEFVGGVSTISNLNNGMPHLSNIASYVEVMREKAALRQIIKTADKLSSEACAGEDLSSSILSRAEQDLAEINTCSSSETHKAFITSFAELMKTDFDDGEMIAGHACRGEILLVQSVTNHGKSTMIRNLSLALATGGQFLPLAERSPARKVILLNMEGSGGRFQSDLRLMTHDFTDDEIELVHENFSPTHAPGVGDEPLSLSRHMKILETHARRTGADVIIIDTASAAFSLRSENDNSEVANSVMKPLIKLARRLNCLIILIHHIGKAKLEEGQTREQAHRGRGASAWGDFSTSIFNLEADPKDKNRIVLTCGKRKDGEGYESVLRLNRESRWFEATDEPMSKPVTNDELVIKAMQASGRTEMATAEIVAALDGRMSERTVKSCLSRLADLGKAISERRGFWSLTSFVQVVQPLIGDCTSCTNPHEADNSSINYNF